MLPLLKGALSRDSSELSVTLTYISYRVKDISSQSYKEVFLLEV